MADCSAMTVPGSGPHPSLRWISRLAVSHCGAGWRVAVPDSPGRHKIVYVFDRKCGGSEERSLLTAREVRDGLAEALPFPLTAILRQYRDGTVGTTIRHLPDRECGPVWAVEYQRLDTTLRRARSAVISRSIDVYGFSGAKDLVEAAWREKVLEQAALVDALVRAGVSLLHHGPSQGGDASRGSRSRIYQLRPQSTCKSPDSRNPSGAKSMLVLAQSVDKLVRSRSGEGLRT